MRRLHSDAVRTQSVTADLFMITIISINLCLKGFWDQKVRRAGRKGGKTFNPKKRTKEDDERFERNLLKILNKATS